MSADGVSILVALAITNLALGWYLGFRSLPSYLSFWILCLLAGMTAWRMARSVFPWAGVADAIVRSGVLFFAVVVLAGLTLGSAGFIGTVPYMGVCAAAFLASRALKPPREPVDFSLARTLVPIAALLIPLLVCIVAAGLVRSPLTLYDSLSYHLVFPARWLQEGRLSIIQTPFSDPAQAYQPSNGELFFLWLMLPFHGDLLARIGQLPFLLLGGTALYAIARRSGATPVHAVYAPVFLVLVRPVVEQAVGADVDLICAATFLASLYLGIAAVDSGTRRDWILWGVSLGLYLGTKYLALVYLPVLLLPALLRGGRLKAAWGLPGIALFGLPWYARNWLIAGSPIYPSSLGAMGITIARGAFTRAALNNSVFHVTDLRLWPIVAAKAFGAPALLFWLPCALLGAVCLVLRRRWWPGGYVLLLLPLMVLLEWLGVPDNADARFLLPAVVVAMVPLTCPFTTNRTWNACLHTAYFGGAIWMLLGTTAQMPTRGPWFMSGWLSLEGILSREALPLFAVGAVISACAALVLSRARAHAIPALAAGCAAGCVLAVVGTRTLCVPAQCEVLATSSPYIRATFVEGWQWSNEHIAGSTIAYTGNNVPYPLFGEHLSNRVRYVNIDRHADWLFHDYARTRGKAGTEPANGLAHASGQLLPVRGGRIQEASRPRFERWEGTRDAWVRNLRSAGAGILFVSALSAYEIDYVSHNARGFPVEDDWARADPQTFTLTYENDLVRIYAIAPP